MQFPRLAADTQPHRRRHTTLVLGRLSPEEHGLLKQAVPASAEWLWTSDVKQALSPVAAGRVDRVLLVQARPGELGLDLPERLLAANPELELLSVAGAWCEGELRTGQPWQDVTRVYWGQLADDEQAPERPDDRPLAVVNAVNFDNASAWIDALAELGYAGVWSQRGAAEPVLSGEALGIWDGAQLDGQEANALAVFCTKRRGSAAPVLAVFDFPRADAVLAAREIGATEVIGRPWSLEEVSHRLASMLSSKQIPVIEQVAGLARKAA